MADGEKKEQVVWKFKLGFDSIQSVDMPAGAQILCLQMQDGYPCVWALCRPHAPLVPRLFGTYATGQAQYEVSVTLSGSPAYYVGTYQINGGRYVYHVFEVFTSKEC